MKILRIILFPIVPFYYLVTRLRNWLYDRGFKSSKSYDVPIICVGNLSTGGTGKTPMIEYLITLLSHQKSIATLSRGYKRVTDGFIIADQGATVDTIGDEPYQFYRKYNSIKVAVDGDRQNGISQLLALPHPPDVILLDDAYQHRKVKAGLNVLLTTYTAPYCGDIVLPTGNLREPRTGASRADVIVVTKCPFDITEEDKYKLKVALKISSRQHLFFGFINYSDKVMSMYDSLSLEQLNTFTLVTGIANAKPLVSYLQEKGLTFEHLEFPDHYSFKPNDIEIFSEKTMILTTEKDYVRLSDNEILQPKLYYLPIEVQLDNAPKFDRIIKTFTNIN